MEFVEISQAERCRNAPLSGVREEQILMGNYIPFLHALVLAFSVVASVNAQVGTYSQDFEGLNRNNGSALDSDGWRVFAAVFDDLGVERFNYGPFAAPNIQVNAPSFSNIEGGEGGAEQGLQYLNVFSDYNCCNADPPSNPDPTGHQNGTDIVQARVFQEVTVGPGDIGTQLQFSFDAKIPNVLPLEPTAEIGAFVITLDPNNNFATTAESFVDLTPSLSQATWESFTVLFDIDDASLDGQILQFGFQNREGDFRNTGVYYDNINVITSTGGDGDFDGDGDVDGQDFLGLQRNNPAGIPDWQVAYPSPLTGGLVAVPEPSSALLAVFSLFFLASSKRSR